MKVKIPDTTYLQPAEWEPHRAVWLAWPSHADLWQENLEPAQVEFANFCKAIADMDPKTNLARGEKLEILVPNAEAKKMAGKALLGLPVRFHEISFGDIWLRDTGPIFVKSSAGQMSALQFQFNGWGKKYELPYDAEVSRAISAASSLSTQKNPTILEGGSIEVDGEGTCLTTEQCLLNPNRNSRLGRAGLEQVLRNSLGIKKVLWLKDGMLNDHTDGHIDTLVRFVTPGVVVCMRPADSSDPNFDVLNEIYSDLLKMTDACERSLKVITIPSPGRIVDEDGRIMPASYVNFYIANTTVIVPTYGSPFDHAAVTALSKIFVDRRVVGLSARAILSGGGAFHCISQQEPL